jgi:hypothetical protein
MADPNLKRRIAATVLFLLLTCLTSVFLPHQINSNEYQNLDSSVLLASPAAYERCKVSIGVTIVDVDEQSNLQGQLLETTQSFNLFLPKSLGSVTVGDHVSLRGVSYVSSRGYIEITEFYIHDYPIDGVSRSLLHSIPGILVFVAIFFAVFRFDLGKLRFVSRRD